MSCPVSPTYRSGFAAPKRIGSGLTFRNPSLWRGCVGAWCPSLGETGSVLFDHSVSGNNGTLTAMDASTDWVASDGQLALDFDGTDDYVNIGAHAVYCQSRMSVVFWLKANVTPTAFDGILGKTNGNSWNQGWGCFWDTTSTIRFFGDDWGTNYSSSGTIAIGVWYHVTGVFDATNVTLYINGRAQTSGSYGAETTLGAATDPLEFGRLGTGDTYNFNGQLDDIRIYDRVLSISEIGVLARRRAIAYESHRVSGVKGAAITAPTSLTATSVSETSIRADWAHVGGAANFELQRRIKA